MFSREGGAGHLPTPWGWCLRALPRSLWLSRPTPPTPPY